jgi:hypothetical protein
VSSGDRDTFYSPELFAGAPHYYPGSHRLAVYEPHDLGLDGSSVRSRDTDYRSYEDFLARPPRQGDRLVAPNLGGRCALAGG